MLNYQKVPLFSFSSDDFSLLESYWRGQCASFQYHCYCYSYLILIHHYPLDIPTISPATYHQTIISVNPQKVNPSNSKDDIPMIEGSLEVKLPTIWTDEKQSRAEAERREKIRREKSRRKSQKKEDADARKGRKVAKHCVFPMI